MRTTSASIAILAMTFAAEGTLSLASAGDTTCAVDLTLDGAVDGADLAALLSFWGACGGCPEDIDANGTVDGQDLSLLLGSWGALPTDCAAGPSSERHVKWPVGTRYAAQGYWEYLPHRYDEQDDWPLLVFLHGVGGNGNGSANDLDRVAAHGPARLVREDRWPVEGSAVGDRFVVLSPQNPIAGECHSADNIDSFLRWAIETYQVDPTRIYLTGLSCGAIGTWRYLTAHLEDDLLAAAVPICGDGIETWNTHGCTLGDLPIWGFHGDADDVVNAIGTFFPLANLQSCTDPKAEDARLTIYPGVGHDSWSRTYDLEAGHDIYAWLLSHRNTGQAP
jgi:dienelactone hydrolase